MNRLLDFLRGRLAGPPDATDRQLLDRFVATREDAAFAELVRRYGPLVWGVCHRRLHNTHDAEDAFQATFLVLVRRAVHLSAGVPLGPWLHRVAFMTARNVARGNRRRGAVTGPMEHDTPAPAAGPDVAALDLDEALLALPERYRTPVVLCHLQGMSRREAAARLGCAEGTLSSLLSRALGRLRSRLGVAVPAVLVLAVPPALSAATARAATIFTTSTLTAAGIAPSVVHLTDGVLRMFWMKKLTAALALAVVVTGGLFAGLTGRTGEVARATEPLPAAEAAPDDADEVAKRLERQLADLQKQQDALKERMERLADEKAKLEELQRAKAAATAAAELGTDIAVDVGEGKSSFTVREVVNGKVSHVSCSDVDILTTYLARAFKDPKGPKKLRLTAFKDHPLDHLKQVFAACATAGYTKATFNTTDRVVSTTLALRYLARTQAVDRFEYSVELPPKPGEIDLTKYAPKKP